MIEEKAVVTAINAGNITVESELKSACSGCQQVDNCGSGQVAKAFPQKKYSLTLSSTMNVDVGDTVIIGLQEALLLKTAWQVYMWPLLGMIVAGAVGQYFINAEYFSNELIAIFMVIAGGYLGFSLAKKQQNTPENIKKLQPKLLRVEAKAIVIAQIND